VLTQNFSNTQHFAIARTEARLRHVFFEKRGCAALPKEQTGGVHGCIADCSSPSTLLMRVGRGSETASLRA